MGKCRHERLVAHHLLGVATKLALDLLLCAEARGRVSCDPARGQHGERCQHEHHERHGDRERAHVADRDQNGHDAAEELGESLEEPLPHRVDVVDHAAQEVTVGVGVDKRQGEYVELGIGLVAQVA